MTFSGVISHLRPFYNRMQPGCVVLCYHRVGEHTTDRWRNVVSVKNFRAHMESLSRKYLAISMDQLIHSLKEGKLPGRRTAVVTFDDGYAVNSRFACSILSDLKIPATFYITTYLLDQSRHYWWDELQHLLVDHNEFPQCLSLVVASQEVKFPYVTKNQKDHFFFMVQNLLKGLRDAQRNEILEQLARLVPVSSNHSREREPITSAEIRELSLSKLFAVGGHSHSHCSLSLLSLDEQQFEIAENKKILESLTGTPIKHFSFPFGGMSDIDETSIKMVRENGYVSAATMMSRPARTSDSVYGVPRVSVKDWDGPKFERVLIDLFAR